MLSIAPAGPLPEADLHRSDASVATPLSDVERSPITPGDFEQNLSAPSSSVVLLPRNHNSLFGELVAPENPILLDGRAKSAALEALFPESSSLTLKLSYAVSEQNVLREGENNPIVRYGQWTAVYDISAHTVYMPDGTKLEAHSGLGDRLDDPGHANERNRGATPPSIYDLELRDQPFHGVRALRLIPSDDRKVFGRTGFLAHSYMLGPNGSSHGCVVFRDYRSFLEAYVNHEIKRLVVVARLD